jgi:hypothetical protein
LFRFRKPSTQPAGKEAFAIVVIQISFYKTAHDQKVQSVKEAKVGKIAIQKKYESKILVSIHCKKPN